MTPLDPQIPPVGEEIHLPGPSIQPVLLSAAITVTLIGVTISLVMVIAGSIVAVATIVRWILDTRRDIEHLPLEHHH